MEGSLTLTETVVAASFVATNGAVAYLFTHVAYKPVIRVIIASIGVAITLLLLFSVLNSGGNETNGLGDIYETSAASTPEVKASAFVRHPDRGYRSVSGVNASCTGYSCDRGAAIGEKGLAVAEAGNISIMRITEEDEFSDDDSDIGYTLEAMELVSSEEAVMDLFRKVGLAALQWQAHPMYTAY